MALLSIQPCCRSAGRDFDGAHCSREQRDTTHTHVADEFHEIVFDQAGSFLEATDHQARQRDAVGAARITKQDGSAVRNDRPDRLIEFDLDSENRIDAALSVRSP